VIEDSDDESWDTVDDDEQVNDDTLKTVKGKDVRHRLKQDQMILNDDDDPLDLMGDDLMKRACESLNISYKTL
jgi:hypothetical protein